MVAIVEKMVVAVALVIMVQYVSQRTKMFVILIRGRNCRKYIEACLLSLRNQIYEDWRAHIVLDAPTDGVQEVIHEHIGRLGLTGKINVVLRPERKGLAYNIFHGVHEAEPCSEDIVGILDADDTLSKKALLTVSAKYQKHPALLLTYGSYKKKSKCGRTRVSRRYPLGANVRNFMWRASHFKTFKYKLFKRLPESCFKYRGKYFEAASDVALMIPLIEIAGLDRCLHIHKMIYVWRDNTAHKTNREKQIKCEKLIRAKKPMSRVHF